MRPLSLPQAPEKPREGQPCNGCGYCCAAVTCGLARDYMNAYEAPCPAMEFEGGRFWCGLVRTPHRYIPGLESKPWTDEYLTNAMKLLLGIGRGCDSTDPTPIPPEARK